MRPLPPLVLLVLLFFGVSVKGDNLLVNPGLEGPAGENGAPEG